MKKMTLNDLKKGKLSKNVINNLKTLTGGKVISEYCHPVYALQAGTSVLVGNDGKGTILV